MQCLVIVGSASVLSVFIYLLRPQATVSGKPLKIQVMFLTCMYLACNKV